MVFKNIGDGVKEWRLWCHRATVMAFESKDHGVRVTVMVLESNGYDVRE
jgi:hypothetical protein